MRRCCINAVVVAALFVLDPLLGTQQGELDVGAAHLERLTVERGDREATVSPRLPPTISHDIPLRGDGRHLIVEGTLNGTVTGPMLIDTGASYCVLTRGTARRLGLGGHARGSIPVATANGQVAADIVELDALQIRGAHLAHVDAVIMDAVEPPLIGIVGLSYLSQFRFSVDPRQHTLRLEQ